MSELDLTYLNEISGGDEEFIAEMIETFLEETPKDAADMRTHLGEQNWTELGKVAHKLKSSIKMFGFETLKNQVLFLEQSGKSGENTDVLPSKVNEFLDGLDAALEELRGKL